MQHKRRGKDLVRTIAVILCILCMGIMVPAASHATEAGVDWVVQYQTSNPVGWGSKPVFTDLAEDAEGNVYAAGQYAKYVFFVKYDTSGNELWRYEYETVWDTNLHRISMVLQTDPDGNLYAAFIDRYQWTLLKFDPDGNFLWDTVFTGAPEAQFLYRYLDFKMDESGNIFLSGGAKPAFPTPTWRGYAFAKFDTDGNLLWYDVSPALSYAYPVSVSPDGAGGAYVSGLVIVRGSIGYTLGHSLVRKYDPSGAVQWSERFGDGSNKEFAYESLSDGNGNVFVLGARLRTDGLYGLVKTKYLSDGTQAFNIQGDNVMPWRATAAASVDPSGDLITVSGPPPVSCGYCHNQGDTVAVQISKTDGSTGDTVWSASYAGGERRGVAEMNLDNDGNILLTGIVVQGGKKLFMNLKYSSTEGSLLWEGLVSPRAPVYWDVPLAGLLTAKNELYNAGYLWSGYPAYGPMLVKIGGLNAPPVADAGVDQTVEATSPYGAGVVLNGTGSYDPDEDQLEYEWSGPFGTASGATPAVTVPLGTYEIILTVDDGKGGTASDTVMVTVQDTTPPVISILGVEDGATYALGLVPSASYTAEDAVSGLSDSSDSLSGGDGLGLGTFAYTVTATDGAGNTATATASYEVIVTVEGLRALIEHMIGQGLIAPQMRTSLLSKVDNADKAANSNAADGILNALIGQIFAQSGKKIDPQAAQVLINAVQYLIDNN